tara:strand:+ start:448 stop:705 length:258 start_codon:yes stop_codon:yes gene_type:complete
MSNINDKFGENCFGGRMRIQTEVVNGVCPTCNQKGVLVSLFKTHYRCVTCGSDLEQKVNGVISYIPMGDPNTRMVLEETDGPQKA